MPFWFTGADKMLEWLWVVWLHGWILSDPFILAMTFLQLMFVANSKWKSVMEICIEHWTQFQSHNCCGLTAQRKVYGVAMLQLFASWITSTLLQSALCGWERSMMINILNAQVIIKQHTHIQNYSTFYIYKLKQLYLLHFYSFVCLQFQLQAKIKTSPFTKICQSTTWIKWTVTSHASETRRWYASLSANIKHGT
jgi:hypothetical protein